ncbi:Aminopeptidase N [Limosilactobacillus gastricus PS3]|uniref:Aminopeptidase n=1 Tax=Limosilactobacillus gastricus PS3 TaxID=1144300 RepID=H4GJ22_9LACO|nr:M1 family metallopeptidase [Limosilactobacillus gastricus]EHS87098.1 Aminopeptidase N [Limosilactobacillus gastricus PS3]
MAISRFYDLFQPENYQIKLAIDRQAKTITGQVTITGHASQTDLQLHQKFLQVSQVLVNQNPVDFTSDDEQESLQFTSPSTGELTITVNYTAPLTDTMMGIYPSYYQIGDERKQLIGTQFETTFARQAFPSIDEPEAKATFDLAIKFDEQPGETILANMPETKVVDGYHYFQRTVKMSTYLVAFAFGDLQSKLTQTKSGVQVGVFATKAHAAKELDFALDIAKRAIEFYEDYYQTPYPLPHSWQLALPDFSAGAMENWGLVTYREAYLLLDPDNTALEMKQVVATVITHELAHQWFGDLVTMQWWDDLWLNESFANMMEYVAVDALEPDWHVWDLFQTTEVPMATNRDATDGVQSVHVDVNNPAEIDSIFDGAIVYAKGSRMLVMVRSLIGDDALRKGLKNYFAAHQYGNAKGADLWEALGQAANMPIGDIMNSWLEQPGYPVVQAKVENGHLILKQAQFFIGEHQDQGRQWQIPLNSNYAGVPKLMTTESLDLGDYQSLRQTAGKPFLLNQDNQAHFIVQYDTELFNDLLAQVDQLSNSDQREFLQDLSLLAQGQYISYADLIPRLGQFANQSSYIVTDVLYQTANKLKQFIQAGQAEEKYLQDFFKVLSQDQLEQLGWTANQQDTNDQILMRPTIISAALYGHNQVAIRQAHDLFAEYHDHLVDLPADTRGAIIKNELQHYLSAEVFHELLNTYRTTTDPSFKVALRGALTSITDADLIQHLIGEFENAETIKPQDLRGWFQGLLANEFAQQYAWDWIRNDWDWLEATVGGDMEFATYITVISRVFKTADRLAEFKAFFEPKLNTPGLTREIEMDTKVIASRVALVQAEKADVLAALQAYNQ